MVASAVPASVSPGEIIVAPQQTAVSQHPPLHSLIRLRCSVSSTQEADGALNGRYRASWYFKLNTMATMARTIGQKMLASGPTVPPVSHRGPLNDALRRFWEGSRPLFGTPYKNV